MAILPTVLQAQGRAVMAGAARPMAAAAPIAVVRAAPPAAVPVVSSARIVARTGVAHTRPTTVRNIGRPAGSRRHFVVANRGLKPGCSTVPGLGFDVPHLAAVCAQAAEALHHAHELGVVHRDVKPANLLLDEHGDTWVADFGLAQIQGDAQLTVSGDLVGTLRYMSPEQALAKRVLVDHRTDIYSLGATLYELLTLKPVFTVLMPPPPDKCSTVVISSSRPSARERSARSGAPSTCASGTLSPSSSRSRGPRSGASMTRSPCSWI